MIRPLVALAFIAQLASALRFDLPSAGGHTSKNERCIRNFVMQDQLVVVTAIVDGNKGDGQVVNMHVRGPVFPIGVGDWGAETRTGIDLLGIDRSKMPLGTTTVVRKISPGRLDRRLRLQRTRLLTCVSRTSSFRTVRLPCLFTRPFFSFLDQIN